MNENHKVESKSNHTIMPQLVIRGRHSQVLRDASHFPGDRHDIFPIWASVSVLGEENSSQDRQE